MFPTPCDSGVGGRVARSAAMGRSRWGADAGAPRGAAYDQRFASLAASGVDVHGEAALVDELVPRAAAVLDGGCGTGRVAIELARRGHEVVGVDLDPGMLGEARGKAPHLEWVEADLATLDLGRSFDAVVLAGNVLLFVAAGTEGAVVARAAAHLRPGGLLVAGFQCTGAGYGPPAFDGHAADAGLTLAERWSTWDRRPWKPGADFQVSVHRRSAAEPIAPPPAR